ncbi:MAG: CocE/NonD family hydrolase [Acidobacteria bacterium]|nr:CocE/NonD family hydrolase [Acidobacteriota bacterium]
MRSPLQIAFLLAIILAPTLVAADPTPLFSAAPPPRNDIVIENRVPIPMRDGVILYADVYRPVGDKAYPVLVSRTPYSVERAPAAYTAAVFFARRGYAYVFQDVRGRHESEGVWDPARNEFEDGYDTVEWAGTQPWSNGKVGMQGGSYLGTDQWQAAKLQPPHLVSIFPAVAATSSYHHAFTLNGGFRLSLAFGWGPVRQESQIMQNTGQHTMEGGPENISYDKVLWHLPLSDMQKLVGRNAKFYQNWIEHPDYDDYWKAVSVEEHFDKMQIPAYNFGGWFDILLQGTLHGYTGVHTHGGTEAARRGARLQVGAWGHGPSRKHGDIDFGPTADVDSSAIQLRWYDYTLKGIDNGIAAEPPVALFQMGRNRWRYHDDFPLPDTQYRELYFHSNGKANSYRGNGALSWDRPASSEPTDGYRYDPDHPVPSHGGANCCGSPTLIGPVDQRPVEQRNDVLVYTSDFLEQEVDVTGPVKVVLYAASDAVDTDWVAKLVDIHPDGKAYNVAEGILRARHREGQDKPKLMEPGTVYRFEIDLLATSNAFLPGHRIRVDITSSHFPQFDRHLNTGEPFGMSDKVKIAQQTIHHTAARPSHVLLPVIP